MKSHNMIVLYVSALAVLAGCSNFDDSSLWNDVDQAYNQLTEIKSQLEELSSQVNMLSAVVNNGAITDITENQDGGYTIRYKGQDNEEKSVVIAGKEDVSDAPLLGTREDGGVLYWTMTANGSTDYITDNDGARIPVAGRAPDFTIDSEGCWCVNGLPLKDASGNKIKAEGKTISVVTEVDKDNSGHAVLTLADGSTVTVPLFEAFNISLYYQEAEFTNRLQVNGSTEPATISYVISGPSADQTIVKTIRQENLTATPDAATKTIKLEFDSNFETGSFAIMVADAEGNVLIRPVYVEDLASVPEYYGIKTADDLAAFASAVNSGRSLTRYMNEEGHVVLLSDVDMTGVLSYVPIGTADAPFKGIFDGKGFTIKNIALSTDITTQANTGIFGVIEKATVRNLIVGSEGSTWEITGEAATGSAIGGVVAKSLDGSVIEGCTNNISFTFSATDDVKVAVSMAGIVADATGTSVTKCTNNGDIQAAKLTNTENGGNGFQLGGVVGYSRANLTATECENNGDLAAPSGRGGGIVATLNGTLTDCINNGTVEDDKAGQYAGATDKYSVKRMGGLVGGTGGTTTIENCTNNGTVISHTGCRTGGFVGHNTGAVTGCVNNGNIFYRNVGADHGGAWACGFTSAATNITECKGYGRVGDISLKDTPDQAADASHYNAVKYQYLKRYDPEENEVDWTLDSYYEMTETSNVQLADGLKYTAYQWTNVPRKMHVLEVDLTSSAIELTTAMANDIVPNPNANKNSNDGFNIRETLSQLCDRKRSEGEKVLAGINTGFFDSNDGIPRGLHIEEGEPVFVNNLGVRTGLPNHSWALTVFTDGTASCAKKEFKGTVEIGSKEYEYYSINDTIVRLGHAAYLANVYTSRYKETPHASNPGIKNELSPTAFYVVAKYTGGPLTVNTGYASATVTAIHDGRTTALTELPYLTADDEFAVQFTGSMATEVAAAVSIGNTIRIKADVTIGGTAKPIYTQNSTMFQFMTNGADTHDSANSSSSNYTKYDPITFAAVDQAGTKVWLVEIDGRQIDLSMGTWDSMGVKAYEMYRIAKNLGAYNMTRFDGGGSSAMWVWTESTSSGALVSTPCDSKGERSCMNYIYLRAK